MDNDPLEEALRDAAAPIIRDILEDREQLPHQLSALMLYIAEHICEPGFNATKAKRATKVRNHTLATLFRDHMGMTLRVYIEVARLRIAQRLLHRSRLTIGQISLAVGYSCHDTFLRAYKAWAGESPAEARGKPWTPEVDYSIWHKLWYGELAPEAAHEIIEKLQRIYPEPDEQEPEREVKEEPASLRIPIDAETYMRFQAEEAWRQIRDLRPEVQRRLVRECDFRSRALFDLLRKKSRLKGRRDRQQGIFLAQLALDSLEGVEEFFGELVHDLRALGHAWLANAHRLAFDFSAADAEFDRADAEWRRPRQTKDMRVQARINDLKTSLRTIQRNYDEALRLAERSQELYRLFGDSNGEARSLIKRSAIYSYIATPRDSINALQQANALLDSERDPRLTLAVHCNLAIDFAKLESYPTAAVCLAQARSCSRYLNDSLETFKIQWVDAVIQQGTGTSTSTAAEELFVAARRGYSEAGEFPSFGIISLDLAILYSEQDRWHKVVETTSQALPILSSMKLYDETLTAIALLVKAIDAGQVSSLLLRQVRDLIQKDPLAKF